MASETRDTFCPAAGEKPQRHSPRVQDEGAHSHGPIVATEKTFMSEFQISGDVYRQMGRMPRLLCTLLSQEAAE